MYRSQLCWSRPAPLGVGLAAMLFASACAPAATQLVVSVDTDLPIPGELDRVEVIVTGPTGVMASQEETLPSASALPLSLAVIPSGEALGPISVVAIGYRGRVETVRRAADVTLVRGETRVLPLFLLARCRGVDCEDDESCGEDGCAPRAIAELPPWTGQPPRIPRDAGPMDAASDAAREAGIDAGPCRSAADCDDDVPCTVDSCAAGGCSHQPDDGMCSDDELCTDDTCGPTGCAHAPNAVQCDDGSFCNGFDTCGASTCSVHDGDPCGVALACVEALDQCEGCTTTSECPAPNTGAWSACDYADGCDEAGQRSRTVRTFTCNAMGSCVGADETETEACTRATAGTTCGAGSCGAYQACAFAATCDETGTENRTCTDLVCGGGVCAPMMRTESRPCTRSTTGTSCGTTTCDAFGACGAFPSECAESGGTQSRTCTDLACAGGSCGMTARTESQACTRVTSGAGCGSPSCSAWTDCASANTCATSGTQSRTCTAMSCSAGACAPVGAMSSESQACSRVTDGLACDVDRCSPGGTGTCSSGVCDGFSDCPEPCICSLAGVCRQGGSFCPI